MNDNIRCVQSGKLSGGKWDKLYDESRRYYSPVGLSPTLHTRGGDNTGVKIIEEQKYLSETDNAYEVRRKTKSGDFCIQRKRYAKSAGIAGTILTSHFGNVVEPCICASRGRNPENPSDRTAGADVEQRIELGSAETSNTLTTVQKDNLAIEPLNPYTDDTSRTLKAQYANNGLSNFTRKDSFAATGVIEKPTYRIRKLTPLECIRLMDFDDEDYKKIRDIGVSDSQIYAQCGNSIVVACLYGIFDKLLIHTEITEPQQISLFD